jgi:hypothetical protein
MGMKEDTARKIGFTRLAILRPGIIVGNAHTPAWVGWLGRIVPGQFGNIDQRVLGRSIAAEIALHSRESGEVTRHEAVRAEARPHTLHHVIQTVPNESFVACLGGTRRDSQTSVLATIRPRPKRQRTSPDRARLG